MLLAVAGCGGSDATGPPAPEGFGRVEVTLARAAGGPSLMFSASIQVAGGSLVKLEDGDTEAFSNVPAGTQTVEASFLTANCTVQDQNPRSVSVSADQTTGVTLEVTCAFDGEARIVFLRREPQWDFDVWTVKPDGTGLDQVTGDKYSISPAWSPDGTRIAWTRSFAGISELWIMNYDGTEERRVAELASLPAWSPDGTRIAFAKSQSVGGPSKIWVMDPDGSNQTVMRSTGTDRETMPAWSHDGRRIAFCWGNGGALAVMEIDGSEPLPLTEEIGCGYPVWAPDDSEIVFASAGPGGGPQIYRIGSDGSFLTLLTDIEGGCGAPSYSPDGSSILFSTHGNEDEPEERAWIMDADGGNPRHFDAIPWERSSHLRWWGG